MKRETYLDHYPHCKGCPVKHTKEEKEKLVAEAEASIKLNSMK